jgi:hypothetical protein
MSLFAFLSLLYKKLDENKEMPFSYKLREGQLLCNTLTSIRPDLSDRIRNTENDPYFCELCSEQQFQNCLAFLNENW